MNAGRISQPSSMLELVRALASARKEAAQNAGVANATAQEPGGPVRDLPALRQKLSAMLDGLDIDDEQAVAKARRPVLQEIVLWEFGNDFRQHPEFAPMLETIERAFVTDPKAPARFAALVRDLKR